MSLRSPIAFLSLAVALLASCAPAPNPVVTPTMGPSSAPASPSATPGTPVPAASATPAIAPSAAPSAAAFSMESGVALGGYLFNGPTGIAFEPGQQRFVVTDASSTDLGKVVLRKLTAEGAYVSTVQLAPAKGNPPTRVDSVAFDRLGNPYYAYRDGEVFQLLVANGGTISQPLLTPNTAKRAGVTAVGADGDIVSSAVIKLDENSTATTGGTLIYGRSDVTTNDLKAIFSLPDPLQPTARMAFGPNGDLYLAGATSAGTRGLKRLKADQTLQDVPVNWSAIPDGMVITADGTIYGYTNNGSSPAVVHRYGTDGRDLGQTSVRLKAGGYLNNLAGLTFDLAGHPVVVGSGIDAAGHPVTGLFSF